MPQATFGKWDVLLVILVTAMGTVMAYLPAPRLKALVLSLPIPFTMATMAVGRPVDATNVIGLLLLLVYAYAVMAFHKILRLPVIPSIALAIAAYCWIALEAARLLPEGDSFFWASCAAVMFAGLILHRRPTPADEPEHRTSLPVWIKAPLIVCVVTAIILAKNSLKGFVTTFPMVSVLASYEARRSLSTICAQIPVIIITVLPMMVVCRLAQPFVGTGASLAIGWIVYLPIMGFLTRALWLRSARRRPAFTRQ